jgi:hypothetical protein
MVVAAVLVTALLAGSGIAVALVTRRSSEAVAVTERTHSASTARVTTQQVTVMQTVTERDTTSSAPVETQSINGDVNLTLYQGSHFDIDYPNSWRFETAEVLKNGSYYDTTIRNLDDSSIALRVDVTPQAESVDPEVLAEPVVSAMSRMPGYRQLGYYRTTYQGYDALRWEFLDTETGLSMHKVDILFADNAGEGVAVLTEAPAEEYSNFRETFDAIQASLVMND